MANGANRKINSLPSLFGDITTIAIAIINPTNIKIKAGLNDLDLSCIFPIKKNNAQRPSEKIIVKATIKFGLL